MRDHEAQSLSSISAKPNEPASRLQHKRAIKYTLLLFCVVAIALRIWSISRDNIIYPDQIFQTLEPAHHLAFGYGIVTWEWRDGLRSWVFPGLLAAIMRTTAWLSPNSQLYLTSVQFLLATWSVTTVWFGYAWSERTKGLDAALIAAGSCAIWYGLVDFGGAAFTEVAATNFLLPAIYLGFHDKTSRHLLYKIMFGSCCGFALCLRMQLAPAVIFLLLYTCHNKPRKELAFITFGLALPIALFGVVDWLTWSYPFMSFVRYIAITVIHGASLRYGTQPWYWYVFVVVGQFGPMLYFVLLGIRREWFLTAIAFIIVVSHSMISHKEIRFLYPLIPIVMTLASIGIVEFLDRWSIWKQFPLWKRVLSGIAITAAVSALLAPYFVYWQNDSGALIAFNHLRKSKDLCGVAVYDVNIFDTGGYTHLHRNVPILLTNDRSLEKDMPSINAIVAPRKQLDTPEGFANAGCWNGVCLYQRPGTCIPSSKEDEINTLLRASGN
jgi:phosphatidylinositol glycan class B